MADIHWNGARLHYERTGTGAAVLMLHAMSVSGSYWGKVLSKLKTELSVLLPDLVYHGKSSNWPHSTNLSHQDNAQMMRALLEEEKETDEDPRGD